MSTELRADARRNLDRIVEAAADAFAEVGPDVTIDEIARRAGVGHGTVFRRFPTKDALRAAILHRRIDELLAQAADLSTRADAGAAFEEFVWIAAESCSRDRALYEGIERCGDDAVFAAKRELHGMIDGLIQRAVDQGTIRRELDAQDVSALVGAAVMASVHSERPDAWRAYVEVVLDGLRPSP